MCAQQALPDYMVKAELFDKGMHRIWQPGDRFRMYFGGRAGSKQGVLLPFTLQTIANARLHSLANLRMQC